MYEWWFSVGSVAVSYAAFGQGTGPIYLSNVGCTGSESSLLSCSHSGIGVTSCGHYEDAGVVCPCKLTHHTPYCCVPLSNITFYHTCYKCSCPALH